MLASQQVDTPGHPPAVAPGDTFPSRGRLSAAGVHLPQMQAVAVRHPTVAAQAAAGVGPEGFVVATSLLVSGGAMRSTRGARPCVEFRVPCEVEPSLV